jgi:photosystem II stability/assembly factor-like uncharacterized protein
MRFFFFTIILLTCVNLSAQWDTLNTGTDIRFNAIASDDVMGQVAVGLDPDYNSEVFGGVFASGDNGNTWMQVAPIGTQKNVEFWDVDYTPNGRVWLIGDSGRVILQTIWFVTYDCIDTISPYSLRAGAVVDDSVFYCGGEQGLVYRTLDRGATWDTFTTGTTETINDIYFNGASDGWIVCDDGYMAVTGDSGNTWQFVAQPMWGFVDIKSFDYQDSVSINPYLVGSNGVANFSVNGGLNWAGIATGTTNSLNEIRFGTNNCGLIVGDNGFIFRTENAGWTWSADSSSEDVDFFGIAYAADTTAFICGDSGVILRSNVNISSVQSHEIRSFSVGAYPNPSTGPLNLQLMLAAEADITIDVINITGEIIATEYHENVSVGTNVLLINMQSYAEGMYFVRISNGFSAVTMRVVRQ